MNKSWFRHVVATLGMAALLVSPITLGQPDRHDRQQNRANPPKHAAPPAHVQQRPSSHSTKNDGFPKPPQGSYSAPKQVAPPHSVQRPHDPRHQASRAPSRPAARPLPRDHRYIRNDIKPFGNAIRRGPALPSSYRVMRGHPLPHGYGHRLTPAQYAYLPHYAGYEWRSVGRDLVLVAAATGIVYAIVDNILN